MFSSPAVDPLPLASATGFQGSFDSYRSRVSDLPEFSGELPAAAMAEEIETPGEGQIRALLVHAGNPVLSTPNGARLERALPGLDLLVCFDFYVTETTRHADYILPPTSPLEVPEYDLALSLLAVRNVAHFSSPLFDPPAGARHDWEVLAGLIERLMARDVRGKVAAKAFRTVVHRLGAEGLLDLSLRLGPYGQPASAAAFLDRAFGRFAPARTLLHGVLRLARRTPLRDVVPATGPLPDTVPAGGLTLKKLKEHPHGLDLGALEPGRLPERLFTPDKRVQLVQDMYASDLDRLRERRASSTPTGDELVLIGRRHVRSNNSWMHNSLRLVKGKSRCTLMMNPADADARSLEDGATVVVSSRVGEVRIPLEVTDALMPGVVSIPHGWGHHREGVGWTTAEANAGVSINDITDERHIDPLSGTAAFSGVPVAVRAETPAAVEEAAGVGT
jgi:anaerobic selenocysteine-containing dehydrogenase